MKTKIKPCPQCGTPFEQDQPWKRICLNCWLDNKNRREAKLVEQLMRQVEYWKAKAGDNDPEIKRWRDQADGYARRVSELEMQVATLERLLVTERSRRLSNRRSRNGTAIPPEMLRRLIQLVHPDRHGNSDASIKATQWLLDQRH